MNTRFIFLTSWINKIERTGFEKKQAIFHQEQLQNIAFIMEKQRDLNIELLELSPSSSTLSLFDFQLFLNLKKFSTWKRVESNERAIAE